MTMATFGCLILLRVSRTCVLLFTSTQDKPFVEEVKCVCANLEKTYEITDIIWSKIQTLSNFLGVVGAWNMSPTKCGVRDSILEE